MSVRDDVLSLTVSTSLRKYCGPISHFDPSNIHVSHKVRWKDFNSQGGNKEDRGSHISLPFSPITKKKMAICATQFRVSLALQHRGKSASVPAAATAGRERKASQSHTYSSHRILSSADRLAPVTAYVSPRVLRDYVLELLHEGSPLPSRGSGDSASICMYITVCWAPFEHVEDNAPLLGLQSEKGQCG